MNDIENMMINSMIEKNKNNKKENDYYKDGLLYCGNCNTEKEFILPSGRKVPCLCECQAEKEKLEEEKEKLNTHIFYNKKYIDTDYQNVFFKDIENLNEYYKFANKFVDNFDEIKKTKTGLYIFGDTGNGKTYIASAIANELLHKGYKVLMTKNNDAIKQLNETSTYFKSLILEMDLIIIDDFGANRETDFQLEQVYNLINFLYSNKKVVIFTTNIPRIELGNEQNITKKRIYDRVIEMTYGIYLKNAGMRKNIANEKRKILEDLLK